MTPLKLGTLTYDDLTNCGFQIRKSSLGRSVSYIGKYGDAQSSELIKEPLKRGSDITCINGLVIVYKEPSSNGSSGSVTGLIESKIEYMNILDSWKRQYLIVYQPGIIVVPNGNKLEEIENVGFLIHRDSDIKKCNCRLKRSRKTFKLCWVAIKSIYPGEILVGYYDATKHKLFKSKKDALAAQLNNFVGASLKLRPNIV